MQEDSSAEVERKAARLATLARESGLGAIVLGTQPNFAWLTAGRSNRIDISRETGSAMLVVTADGRRFALASAIERPRADGETLAGLGFETRDYPWADEKADASLTYRLAAAAAGSDALGADLSTPHARLVEPHVARLRATLDELELPRYRGLGAECGHVVGDVARHSPPGTSEKHVAARVGGELLARGITPLVLLVGADERIDRYRHPVATDLRWRRRLLIVVCGERGGQVVALSRVVCNGVDEDLAARTGAVAHVFAALLERSQAGATGADLYEAAVAAYAAAGCAGEELRHHQGGAIAYRSREWLAHPASRDVVTLPQAFAWNPTVTGAKLEDTCLIDVDGRIDVVTATPDWPVISLAVRGQRVPVAGVLALNV